MTIPNRAKIRAQRVPQDIVTRVLQRQLAEIVDGPPLLPLGREDYDQE